jgi:hypothetical protein
MININPVTLITRFEAISLVELLGNKLKDLKPCFGKHFRDFYQKSLKFRLHGHPSDFDCCFPTSLVFPLKQGLQKSSHCLFPIQSRDNFPVFPKFLPSAHLQACVV